MSALEAWVECAEECDDLLRAAAVDDSRTTLERILLEGVGAERLNEHRTQLDRNWERFFGDPDVPPLEGVEPLSKEEYVDRFAGNLVHRYRVRAAEALVALGDPRSVEVFDEVVVRDAERPFLRDDTRELLLQLRASLTQAER